MFSVYSFAHRFGSFPRENLCFLVFKCGFWTDLLIDWLATKEHNFSRNETCRYDVDSVDREGLEHVGTIKNPFHF